MLGLRKTLTGGSSLFVILSAPLSAGVIYVDDSARIGGNGQTWNTAFQSLQDALSTANPGDEIRIAQGHYYPDRSDATPQGSGNRNASFVLDNNLTLLGGYAGIESANPDGRNVTKYPVTLTGDLLSNDGPNGANMEENSIHVLVASGVNQSTTIDGVRIASGFANSTPNAYQKYGGGVLAINGGPVFRHCVFESNRATHTGGAVYVENGQPLFDSCTFLNNRAWTASAVAQQHGAATFTNCQFTNNDELTSSGQGGALMAAHVRSLQISDCSFDNHTTAIGGAIFATDCGGTMVGSTFSQNGGSVGGALWLTRCSMLIDSCDFTGNTAGEGGAIALYDADPRIVGCTFTGNSAQGTQFNGGAIHVDSGASPTLINCSFTNNTAVYGAAVCVDGQVNAPAIPVFYQCTFTNNDGFRGALHNEFGRPQIIDCEFWDTDSDFGAVHNVGGFPVISGCLFQNNHALLRGGAIGNETGASGLISKCGFLNNSSSVEGGAISNIQSNTIITSCEFSNNSATHRGGAMINDRCDVQVRNCAFVANSAAQGGAVYNFEFSNSLFSACTFVNNVSPVGAAMRSANSACIVDNSIAWFNSTTPFVAASGSITINRSNLQSPWAGPGASNFSVDPMLVNVNPGAGPIDVSLLAGSPCIDAAFTPPDAACRLDLNGNERAVDDPNTLDTGTGARAVMDIGAVEFASVAGLDCNVNAAHDACDIGSGLSPDCNGNRVPDVCDVLNGNDCNANRIPDECEIDCNTNGTPDACDIQSGASGDCNSNGVPDECEPDCDNNRVPDVCDLSNGAPDCNHNNVIDSCEIAAGSVLDCDGNGVPDECQPDCNNNDIPDVCDIADGTSMDVNMNGIPDECEPDCNNNDIPDFIEIQNGTAQDCNDNLVIDVCEIADGFVADCNNNGLIDVCEIAQSLVDDCNRNNRPDQCDLFDSPMVQYSLDDGFPESLRGNPAGGGMIWLNQFEAVSGGTIINGVQIAIGYVPIGEPLTIGIWRDPNGDGNPTDAQLLVTAVTHVWSPGQIYPSYISVPPTFVGPVGTMFFVGAHIAHVASTPPAALDTTNPDQHRSWFAYGSNLTNLAANPTPPANIDTILPGDWQIRARSGSTIDINGDGIPDSCKPCPGDIVPPVGDGQVNVSDLLAVVAAWGSCAMPCPPKCDADIAPEAAGDCAVNVSDLLLVISTWGPCP